MNIEQMRKEMKLEKFFVDKNGEIYVTEGLHEELAREICEQNNWEWRAQGMYSAVDYLLQKKAFIKVSNYGDQCFRYVAMGKRFIRNKRVIDNAEYITNLFNLRLEMY